MTEVKVVLNTVDKVKRFEEEVTKFVCDCDLVSGNYVIDAKSLLGIFSLDLSKPLILRIHENHADISSLKEWTISDPVQM